MGVGEGLFKVSCYLWQRITRLQNARGEADRSKRPDSRPTWKNVFCASIERTAGGAFAWNWRYENMAVYRQERELCHRAGRVRAVNRNLRAVNLCNALDLHMEYPGWNEQTALGDQVIRTNTPLPLPPSIGAEEEEQGRWLLDGYS